MKKERTKGVNFRIMLILVSSMLLISLLTLMFFNWSINDAIYKRIRAELVDNSNLAMNVIDSMYPGSWSLKENELYKGEKLINGDENFVDAIYNSIKAPATIFAGDLRVSTNILKENKRFINTKAQENVSQMVLKQGEMYIGQVTINEKQYESIYVPIYNENKEVIGMFFIGEDTNSIKEQVYSYFRIIIIVIVSILILFSIISSIFVKRITSRIKIVTNSMISIGEGDLTVKNSINTSDEIGTLAKAQNKMVLDLNNLLKSISEIVLEISISANTLAASSEETNATTEEISRSLGLISDTSNKQEKATKHGLDKITVLATEIQEVFKLIQDTNKLFDLASLKSIEGNETINNLLLKNSENNQASSKVEIAVKDMSESLKKIDVITKTITAVSSQTNLLALNASIEAARAGEAGLGFSVVATEIRKLAEQSADSSNQIKKIIEEIVFQSSRAFDEVKNSKNAIEHQELSVNETKEVFETLTVSISKISEAFAIISKRNSEMNGNKDQMLSLMTEIFESSKLNSSSTKTISISSVEQLAAIEEVAKTAESLNDISQKLNLEINKFRT